MIASELQPLVSLIITSYNREALVGKAIQSSLAQDYPNLEIIICDNNSSDNSDTIIQQFCNDPRVRYIRNEKNIGMLSNFKKATEEYASGKFVTYVSSDDYLINNSFISEAIAAFAAHQTLLVYSAINKSLHLKTNAEAHNTAYAYKVEHNLFNKLLPGKEVFLRFEESHLLNFGSTVFFRDDLIKFDIFRDPNTTYFDLQAILLLSIRGDVYLSDKVSYIQTFHESNESQAATNPEKALVNLNFAEIPYNEALKENFLPKDKLEDWLYIMLKPFILLPMITFYRSNKADYKVFSETLAARHPAVYKKITELYKWRIFKMIHSNKITASLYKKIKPATHV